jgi:hypothetical protein
MRAWRLVLVAASAALAACEAAAPSVVPTEPIELTGGQFIPGPLPGAAPDDSLDAAAGRAGSSPLTIDTGQVLGIARPVLPLVAGATSQSFSGLATPDSVSIGVAMEGAGTGYWVVPVGGPDTFHSGWVAWSFLLNFNPSDPPGPLKLLLVAFDDAGHAGTQVEVPGLCIDAIIPDNLHACLPENPPPAAVISLHWDDDFDLDLHVVTPDGVDINPKNAGGRASDGGAPPAGGPVIDRDSLVNCIPDGFRREDVIFQAPPSAGNYLLYVDPFASCAEAAVRFTIDVYVTAGACPNCGLAHTFTLSGELLAIQATGGASPGLFIKQIALPQGD